MTRNLIFFAALVSLLFFACKKGDNNQVGPETDNSVKIEIVTGNNFTDTISHYILVTLKVTKNGAPLGGYTVYYHGSGCNSDHADSLVTAANGITGFSYWLSGEVGRQTIGVYGLTAQHQKADSVTVTGTGLAPGTGWHQSACTVLSPSLQAGSYCKLSSGRIFANITNGYAYMCYSDDNGRSWNTLKSLGNQHEIQYVVSTPADEVFAISYGDGTFYSNDAGQTWTRLAPQPFNSETVESAVYTPGGKLMITTLQHPLYLSSDKGQTWLSITADQFKPVNAISGVSTQDYFFSSPSQDKDGNLYLVGRGSQTLYKSTDGGANWTPQADPYGSTYAFFIDNNNWFYKGISDFTYGGIYISKNSGATYELLYFRPGALFTHPSVQTDGSFYFDERGLGLCTLHNITGSVGFLYADTEPQDLAMPYIVAKNGNIITTDRKLGRTFYYQK